MPSIKERLTEAREKAPVLDHAIRMQEHYGEVKAQQQAGGITYFAFLSFFPVLALAFFVVGIVSNVYPAANANLVDAIDSVLPGIIGTDDGQISLSNIRTFSGIAAVVGLAGVAYSGTGWVSALRQALVVVFETPDKDELNFVLGKLRDLLTLAVIGVILILAVAVAGFASGFADTILDFLGLGDELAWVVVLLTVVLGLLANAVLFFAIFRLLAEPGVPTRSLWSGAALGAIGFEVLKQISGVLLASTKEQPAFQAFGIALVLVVWINYFSLVVLYSAAWAYTTPEARAARPMEDPAPVQGPASPPMSVLAAASARGANKRTWVGPFAAGGAAAIAAVAVMRRKEM